MSKVFDFQDAAGNKYGLVLAESFDDAIVRIRKTLRHWPALWAYQIDFDANGVEIPCLQCKGAFMPSSKKVKNGKM